MITFPHAKINIGLQVTERRPDGYHNLDTVFYPIPIHDVLEVIVAEGADYDCRLHISGITIEGDTDNNLVVRAYRLLAADYAMPSVDIYLHKHIPTGAGLGGGSADAAFTLKMLNEMFSLGLSEPQLSGYASRLGSDCAFFIYNRPMIGEGRGEILTEYDLGDLFGCDNSDGKSSKYDLQVLVPEGISVSTADAYGGIVPKLPEVALRNALARPIEQWDGVLVNDFETTVFEKHPALAAIKRSLYDSGAVYASMSGSGSALFAVYPKS